MSLEKIEPLRTFCTGGQDIELCEEHPSLLGGIATKTAIIKSTKQKIWLKVVPKVASRKAKKRAWQRQNFESDDEEDEYYTSGGEEKVEKKEREKKITELDLILALAKIVPKHPSIACLLGVIETDNFYYCLCEMASGTSISLAEFLRQSRYISEATIFHILHQVLSAVSCIHKHLLWHSDLSLDSIYVDQSLTVKIHNLGVSILQNHEKSPTSSLFGGEGSFRCMGEHFAHDLRQIGVIAASLAMGRPFRSIQQQHHQQHHQHHQHHHHHQQHHQEDDISTNLLNSVLAEVPVSGKLKHLIVRMVTARPAKGFGLQDVVAHPWFRSQSTVADRQAITQSFNYNDPIRHTGTTILALVGFLGMPKAIANALESREVNHVKVFVACMSRVMNCLSEDETKELLVEAKKKEEKYMEKASNSCRPSRVQNEDSDDDSSEGKRDDLLIKPLRFDNTIDLMRMKKKREQRRKAYLDHIHDSSHTETAILSSKLSPETKALRNPELFFRERYNNLSRRAQPVLQLESAVPVISTRTKRHMRRAYTRSFWKQFIPGAIPAYVGEKEKEKEREKGEKKGGGEKKEKKEKKGKGEKKEKGRAKKEKEVKEDEEMEDAEEAVEEKEKGGRKKEKKGGKKEKKDTKKEKNLWKHFPEFDSSLWGDFKMLLDPSSDLPAKREEKQLQKTLKSLGRESPSKGDLRAQFFKGSDEMAPELQLMKKSLFSGATEREKAMEVQFHKYYPCFTRLCLPYKPPLRRSNSTSSLFVTYTIDVMDLKEVVKCASHALYLIILYCHGRGGFSSMEILNEEAHPMVEDPKQGEIPSPRAIFDFCYNIMTAEDVRADVMVLCVYFVERLVFRHGLMFGALTWRRALFGLMLISTKYWEELSIWNSDFSGHVPKADVEELQSLEMALLKLLNFQVVVPGDIFTKYYFALRGLCTSKEVLPRTELRLMDTKTFFERERKISGYGRKPVARTKSLLDCTFVLNAAVALN